MPFDSASMDLEKAMGRVAETGSNVFTLQCVSGGLERHHAKRLVQFLRHKGIVELSLFRTDLGTHAEACATLCRYLRSSCHIHTLRLRSVMLNATQTRQMLHAMAEHSRMEECVYDGAALNQATDALVALLERNATALRKLDLSCEMWGLGAATEFLARGLALNGDRQGCLQHLSLNGCQLQDSEARPLFTALQKPHHAHMLTHLELRYNQLHDRSLPGLARLLIRGMPHTEQEEEEDDDDEEEEDNEQDDHQEQGQGANHNRVPPPPAAAAATPSESTRLQLLDLASNLTLFGDNTARIDTFCQALGQNVNLKSLYLRNCGVTPYAAEQVAAAAARNTTLQVLDLRQLALPPQAPFPAAFWHYMRDWKGVETLDLDHVFNEQDAAAFLQALRHNTSLLSGSLDGLPAGSKRTVEMIFRRNRWWKRARDLLADNHPALYNSQGGVWMHALSRMLVDVESGPTAAYCTLRERLGGWLESASASRRAATQDAMQEG